MVVQFSIGRPGDCQRQGPQASDCCSLFPAEAWLHPPSRGWKTFLVNHADGIASMDLFVVPTLSFRLLYGFLILLHGRRELLWLGVTAHPTAEWIAQQLTEVFGWRNAPRYVVRDRDRVYGARFISAYGPWASGIGRSRHARRGKMDMRRGSSARSDMIASTMSLSSASCIFAICGARIKGITMRGELICPFAKTRRFLVPSRPAATS